MKFNFDNFTENCLTKVEKSSLKLDTKLKKKAFWKKIHQKVFGRLECNFDKTDETFFSKLRFFVARRRSQMKHDKILQKIEKFFGHLECSLGNAAETFRQRSGGLSLKVRKQFWKIRKNWLFSKCSYEQVN